MKTNSILQLKGSFEPKKRPGGPVSRNLPVGASVEKSHIDVLIQNLRDVSEYWKDNRIINSILVSVYYNRTVAKTNRISKLLSCSGKEPNESIVGAKFAPNEYKHIITHCVDRKAINKSTEWLIDVVDVIENQFGGTVTKEDIDAINDNLIKIKSDRIKKSAFVSIVVESFYIEKFGVEIAKDNIDETSIVSVYETGESIEGILDKLGIDFYSAAKIDDTTFRLLPNQYRKLVEAAPYLVSMAVRDINEFVTESIDSDYVETQMLIPPPSNEPVVGVIDSPFDSSVYFSEWVESKNMIDPAIELQAKDYEHGTKVSSIIVDGPSINPNLNDGCGRFRVRHFGVAPAGRFSSFTVIKAICDIVASNPDIKVWNLSLGSMLEVNENFISPEAAVLDKLQHDNDVIFVIAGTNKGTTKKEHMKIGAPADSINSMVVNAVDLFGKPASYTREGEVLNFYNKPDVSCFGGDGKDYIRACSPLGEAFVRGTSFAAPWISRKLAYLIHMLGMSRELAKALIIDAAIGWEERKYPAQLIGYGVVPKDINDIITTPKDEIKFLVSGVSEEYETYNFKIPVPMENDKYPYVAKATMCYFPKCSRNQGVDYTNTELDIHFGRVKPDGNIDTINNNKQGDEGFHNITEENARKFYRKWDNIKNIIEYPTTRKRAKKDYNGTYGIMVRRNERLDNKHKEKVRFGMVVTLKEINGKNRIEEFIKQCILKGWLVSRIDIDNKIDIYSRAEEEIIFDE